MKKFAILTFVLLCLTSSLSAWTLLAQTDQPADTGEADDAPENKSPDADSPPAETAKPDQPDKDDPDPQQPPAATSDERALEKLQQAREALLQASSVNADIRETVAIGSRKFTATGRYMSGEFPKLRLEFTINVGGATGELLEVCDGEILWSRKSITPRSPAAVPQAGAASPTGVATGLPAQVEVTRRDVERIMRATRNRRNQPQTLLAAELGLGGLPALVAALESSMIFDAISEQEADGQKFTIIQGRWNDEFRKKWIDPSQQDAALPEYVPDRVRIYVDGETQFPTRILYLKKNDDEAATYRILLSLEFTNVTLGGTVDQAQFRYQPSGQEIERDITNEYIRMIEAAEQANP